MIDADGKWIEIPFLADCGADRTVVSADAAESLCAEALATDSAMVGIEGRTAISEFQSVIRMRRTDGVMVHFRGDYIVGPPEMDMSFIGRDITNLLTLVVDRPGDAVCLLSRGEVYHA